MTLLKNVICVYPFEETTVNTGKVKRHDYKNGGFLQTTVQTKTVKGEIFALLSCGHARKQHPHERFKGSIKLSCRHCDEVIWIGHQIAKCEPTKRHEWDARKNDAERYSLENLAMAEKHKNQGATIDDK